MRVEKERVEKECKWRSVSREGVRVEKECELRREIREGVRVEKERVKKECE